MEDSVPLPGHNEVLDCIKAELDAMGEQGPSDLLDSLFAAPMNKELWQSVSDTVFRYTVTDKVGVGLFRSSF
jgi:hypothetical protein